MLEDLQAAPEQFDTPVFASELSSVQVITEADATAIVATQEPAEAGPKPIPQAFVALGLSPELLRAVADLGYTEPTPVQLRTIPKAIPDIHAGANQDVNAYVDLMVSSQTGSGKTAAFLLPVLHQVQAFETAAAEAEIAAYKAAQAKAIEEGTAPPKRAKRRNPMDPRQYQPCRPLALILTPTRELAQQVTHDAVDLVRPIKGCRIATVMGGTPYGIQIQRLQNAAVVVATPGRLLDLQRNGQMQLDGVQFLVVDEADRMLDLGFADDLAEIHKLTQARRQTMMFSATFAPRIMALGERVMRRPERIEISAPHERHSNITQRLYWADDEQHQRKLLDHFLRDTSIEQAIVFAGTQEECDQVAQELADEGFSAAALHGAMQQTMRNRRLQALREGRIQILVATDVAARGIDVPSISHVINHGLPMKAEDYTHRIGRTGRAGRDGLAITIAPQRSRRRVADIEAFTRNPFEVAVVPGLEPKIRPPAPKWGAKTGKGGGKPFGAGAGRGAPRFNDRHAEPGRGRTFEPRGGDSRGFEPRGETRGFEPRGEPRSFEPRTEQRGFDPRFAERRPAPAFERGNDRGDTRGFERAPRQAAAGAPADWAERAVRTPAPRQDFGGDFADRRPAKPAGSFAPRQNSFAAPRGDFQSRGAPAGDRPFKGKPSFSPGKEGFGGYQNRSSEGGRAAPRSFAPAGRPARPARPAR